MVSNLTSVFRRNQSDKAAKKPPKPEKSKVSTSSEEAPQQENIAPVQPPPAAMVLIPTVTIQEAPKEVEISPESSNSATIVKEIHVEGPQEVELKAEEPEQNFCDKVHLYLDPIVKSIQEKYNVAKIRIPELCENARTEFLQYAPSIIIGFAVFLFLITCVSIGKLVKYGAQSEPTFFCKYFSGPFAPLFDALCAPEPFVFADELPRVMGGLVDEILITLSEFFHTIAKGFTVFGTLFTAISNGLSQNVFFGFHELAENLGENITHLIHFILHSFHQTVYFFLSCIATVAGAIAGVFTSVHDYLDPPQPVW